MTAIGVIYCLLASSAHDSIALSCPPRRTVAGGLTLDNKMRTEMTSPPEESR